MQTMLFTFSLLIYCSKEHRRRLFRCTRSKYKRKRAAMKRSERKATAWGLVKSKGRDDSDIYASYELTTARGIATTGTGDVKVAIPFFANFWSRTSQFSPFFDFKASSDEKADADSLKIGLEWFLPLHVGQNPEARFPYTTVDLINSGKIEAPKNFDNVNGIWEMRWLFPSSHFPWNGKN